MIRQGLRVHRSDSDHDSTRLQIKSATRTCCVVLVYCQHSTAPPQAPTLAVRGTTTDAPDRAPRATPASQLALPSWRDPCLAQRCRTFAGAPWQGSSDAKPGKSRHRGATDGCVLTKGHHLSKGYLGGNEANAVPRDTLEGHLR